MVVPFHLTGRTPLGCCSVPAAVRHADEAVTPGLGDLGHRALNLRCRTALVDRSNRVAPGQRHLFGGMRDSIDSPIITVV